MKTDLVAALATNPTRASGMDPDAEVRGTIALAFHVGNTNLSAIQTAIPSWVRARVMAVFLLTCRLGHGGDRAGNSGVALFERRQCDAHIDCPAAFAGADRR